MRVNFQRTAQFREVEQPHRRRWIDVFMMGNVFVIICGLVIMLLPDPIQPVAYELPPAPSLTGALTPNEELRNSRRISESVQGPESMAIHEDYIYAGTNDGRIMKINRDGEASVFAKFGTDKNVSTMGRPLGIRLDPAKQNLYVADAYLGVYKVHLNTGIHEKVFPFDDDFDVTFFNDLDILPNGDIILSEASTTHQSHNGHLALFESASTGRLIRIKPKPREYEVIRSGLDFPNGVQRDMSNKDAVIVGQSSRDNIIRVFVNGEKKGQVEMFAENLPGFPDNIRLSEKGDGYWVAIGGVRSHEFDCKVHYFSRWPTLRRYAMKLLPLRWILRVTFDIRYSLAIKLDLDGRIVESLHDTSGSTVPMITQIVEHSGSLFFGNLFSTGIAYFDRSCKETDSCFFKIQKHSEDKNDETV